MALEIDLEAYACSILPDHVHIVVGRHQRPIDQIVGQLKSAASRQLAEDGLHPFPNDARPNGRRISPWAEGCWKVYIEDTDQLQAAIEYVEENPVKEGKRRQRWWFVVPWQSRGARIRKEKRPASGPVNCAREPNGTE